MFILRNYLIAFLLLTIAACQSSEKEAAAKMVKPTPPATAVAETAPTQPSAPIEPTAPTEPSAPTEPTAPTPPAYPKKEAPSPRKQIIALPPSTPAFSHEVWDNLLRQYVSAQGKVDYKGFVKDATKLATYLEALSGNTPTAKWSRNEKLAYWINVYNAYTVKLIVDNYPVSSITDLHGGKPWDVKWIKLGDKTYSLNQIENDIIRPRFGEPRIHFAVNCAAASCPPLLNRAFVADQLNSQLQRQARSFIKNSKYNRVADGTASVSKIFDWYAVDFQPSVKAYLNKYLTEPIAEQTTIEYMEYDWALND